MDTFGRQVSERLEVGKTYRILMRQMGRKSKNPYVAAEVSTLKFPGKIKQETIAADGKAYMHVRFPEYAGDYLFRIDSVVETANGPVAQATLFLVF